MSETATDRRGRRGGGRDARRQARATSAATSLPYITRNLEPFDILSDETAEIIENNAETILEEIGIDFRDDPEALTILRDVVCHISKEFNSTYFCFMSLKFLQLFVELVLPDSGLLLFCELFLFVSYNVFSL